MSEQAPFNVEEAVAIFVLIRDTLRDEDAKHKKKCQVLRDKLNQVEGLLQAHLTKTGAESIRTKSGTCYVSVKYSASVSDKEAFKNFISETRNFDLLDLKANVTAVKEYAEQFKSSPPGVNLSSHAAVGVRKPD